jgi:transcriptional regulator with XRE-family HTH domain
VVFYQPKLEDCAMPVSRSNKEKIPALVAFGELVRRHRKALDFSQEAFGDACEIDRSYMGGIERGEHNLALVNILKIIKALQIEPSAFFAGMDSENMRQLLEEKETASDRKTLRALVKLPTTKKKSRKAL